MKAVLVTIGSLGDLHPFIAIGQELARRGVAVTLAVPADHLAKVRAAGFHAVAILPGFDTIRAPLGIDEAEAVRRVITSRSFVLDAVVMPSLASSTQALDAVADGADVIVGSMFALAAGIVAETRRVPLVALNLQPMALPSACDPPHATEFTGMVHAPTGPIGRSWNRIMLAMIRAAIRLRYARAVQRVRRAHGLPRTRATPIFDRTATQRATLCCYSPLFAPVAPDAPPATEAIGFPLFDSADGHASSSDPRLTAFLTRGEKPLVFTLGSFLTHAAGDFYDEAARAARTLGRRAVLLNGEPGACRDDGDVLTLGYAPHSLVFPQAAAVIHHGGIGTTGQAIRAGVPQLVVPFFGDQRDNAHRVTRLGIGATLPPAAFRDRMAVEALEAVLRDRDMATRAATMGEMVRQERPAEVAAERIIAAAVA